MLVTTGAVPDRDAARLLLSGLRACFPTITTVWADGGYTGQLVDWASIILRLAVTIVANWSGRPPSATTNATPEHRAAMVQRAMVIIMTRRLAQQRK